MKLLSNSKLYIGYSNIMFIILPLLAITHLKPTEYIPRRAICLNIAWIYWNIRIYLYGKQE